MLRYEIITSLPLWNSIIYRHIFSLMEVEKCVHVIRCIFIEKGEITI